MLPPIFDGPTTRGLVDGADWRDVGGRLVRRAGAGRPCAPGRGGAAGHVRRDVPLDQPVSPWHQWLDPVRYDAHVDTVEALRLTSSRAAHGPVPTGGAIHDAFDRVRGLAGQPISPRPGQSVLDDARHHAGHGLRCSMWRRTTSTLPGAHRRPAACAACALAGSGCADLRRRGVLRGRDHHRPAGTDRLPRTVVAHLCRSGPGGPGVRFVDRLARGGDGRPHPSARKLDVTVDGRPVPAGSWRRRSAAGLVKLLALQQERRLSREQVIDALWPDLLDEAGPRCTRPPTTPAARWGRQDAVVLAGGVVTLLPNAQVTVDVAEFDRAAQAARADGGPDAAAAASERYTGTLLPDDLYEPWTEEPRERLRLRRLDLLRTAGRWEELVAEDPRRGGPPRRGAEPAARGPSPGGAAVAGPDGRGVRARARCRAG